MRVPYGTFKIINFNHMNDFEKDIKLKQFLNIHTPESPDPDFSDRVMKSIFKEQHSQEQLKKDHVLGRSFWIFLSLFVLLISMVAIFPSISGASSPQLFVTGTGMNTFLEGYHSFLSQIETLPLNIATILTATSLLILLGNRLDKKFYGMNARI